MSSFLKSIQIINFVYTFNCQTGINNKYTNLDGNVLNFLYWYWFVNGYFNVHWYFNRVRNLLLHWVGLWNMYFYRVGYLLLDWHVNNLLYRVRY